MVKGKDKEKDKDLVKIKDRVKDMVKDMVMINAGTYVLPQFPPPPH